MSIDYKAKFEKEKCSKCKEGKVIWPGEKKKALCLNKYLLKTLHDRDKLIAEMKTNRKLFAECAIEVETDYDMGGLSGCLYEQYAWDILKKYINIISTERKEANDNQEKN